MNTEDFWREIPGFDKYYVSSKGDILSKCKTTPIILSPIKSWDGHLYVWLYRNNQKFKMYVHRAVLMAWVRMPKEGEDTRHLNGNPQDNRIQNLTWGTRRENIDDMKRHGTLRFGERSATHKLTEKDVIEIRKKIKNHTTRELGREYSVSHTTIRGAVNGHHWRNLCKEQI
jgi:hypothetical protein